MFSGLVCNRPTNVAPEIETFDIWHGAYSTNGAVDLYIEQHLLTQISLTAAK
jgi:hypothetical protein